VAVERRSCLGFALDQKILFKSISMQGRIVFGLM
jgi:hypothetical protein